MLKTVFLSDTYLICIRSGLKLKNLSGCRGLILAKLKVEEEVEEVNRYRQSNLNNSGCHFS